MGKQNNKSKNVEETIIVERMFAGSYIFDNIGHEIINIYKTDEGENYIYISPWGTINHKYRNTKYVMLVRLVNQHCLEILGYAGDLKLLLDEDNLKRTQKEIGQKENEAQNNLIVDHNISYGDVRINELLSEQENVVFVTFKAGKYRKIKNTVDKKYYIVDRKEYKKSDEKNVYFFIPEINFSKQSLKMYFSDREKTDAFYEFKRIIEEEDCWECSDNSKKVDIYDYKPSDDTTNILDYIGKSYDELAYSNWIAYYLNNDRSLLKDFVGTLTENCSVEFDNQAAQILREYKNIDIFIEDQRNVFVIENKIRSGINGVDKERHDIKSDSVQSQLSKYVNEINNDQEKKDKEKHFFIFLPDYNYNGEDLSKYTMSSKYKIIRFSELFDFFDKHDCKLDYYEDFKKAIRKHSFEREKDMLEITNDKLIQTIKARKELL